MIKSMTGFASLEAKLDSYGKISVEVRSSNHKFQEIVLHLPEGYLSLEERIKKIIEEKIKRGRVTCAVNIVASKTPKVFVNQPLLKNYAQVIGQIEKQFKLNDPCKVDTLINLPGVLSLIEDAPSKSLVWSKLSALLNKVTFELESSRKKEGEALQRILRTIINGIEQDLQAVKSRFKSAVKERMSEITTDEERSSFLKNAEITEEIDRLSYHTKNFKKKLIKNTPVGKELDFIAQEMQREANTLAAKSFDVFISARVVEMKSQIEKVREQVQNIE